MKNLISIFLLILLTSLQVHAAIGDLDRERAAAIVEAFNAKPEALVKPLTLDSVHIRNGVGRVDVNEKAKFSYYIQTENPLDPKSPVLLIPMATSRFAPGYYQTDEWWDAHKHLKPMPLQPEEEVLRFLTEMKLSTNPEVLTLKPAEGRVLRQSLQEFLFRVYIQKYAKNGKITLYRGAEREDEASEWAKGNRPRGARYWTPTANYAWRYARKNLNFVEELVQGKAPLLKFEIPVADFQAMVMRRWPHLTLGTELTKRTHDNFDVTGRFQDHLAKGAPYLGTGDYGVEFEIRSNRTGANQMSKYYRSSISIDELAQDRIQVLRDALNRTKLQSPEQAATLEAQTAARVSVIEAEAQILRLIQNNGSPEDIQKLAAQLPSHSELTHIDGFNFRSWIQSKIPGIQLARAQEAKKSLAPKPQIQKSCQAVHL